MQTTLKHHTILHFASGVFRSLTTVSPLILSVAGLVLSAAPKASATTLTMKVLGSTNSNLADYYGSLSVSGALDLTTGFSAGTVEIGGLTGSTGGATLDGVALGDFVAFCQDLKHSLSTNSDFPNSSISMPAYVPSAATFSSPTVLNNIRLLYGSYYKGDHQSDWTAAYGGSAAAGVAAGVAFQLALWEIIYETPGSYDVSSGTFAVTGPYDGSGSLNTIELAGIADAQYNLDHLGTTFYAGSLVSLDNPGIPGNGPEQSLLVTQSAVPIPFGVEAWPGALLLGALGYRRMHRRIRASV